MSEETDSIIAIIPARGGSKGVIRKNIRLLAGKPLIHYSINAALHSKYIDLVTVSTDDDEIMEISRREGATVIKRPPELAGDNSPTIDSVLHVIDQCEIRGIKPEIVVLLQPTSPLRTSADIDSAIDLFLKGDCDSVISITETSHPPYWNMIIEGSYLKPLFNQESFQTRRQDLPRTYLPNGAIYISRTGTLIETHSFYGIKQKPYLMSAEKSVDIDNEFDLVLAEASMKQGYDHD